MDAAALEGLACEVLDAAAAVTVPLFRRTLAVHDKGRGGNFDPVTPADRWAERAMRELLARRAPTHSIEGQEHGLSGRDHPGALRWMLDPIGSTRSYVAGVPLWGTLVGVWSRDEPLAGVVDHPALGERYVASVLGARRMAAGAVTMLHVRPCTRLSDAVLCAAEPHFANGLAAKVRLARFSMDCYAYALLASGSVDLVVDSDLSFHEVAALVPLVRAAGGIISDWRGGTDFATGRIVAAGDSRVHREALMLLG